MEIPDELRCLFSADVDERDDRYTVRIPEQEIEKGDIDENGVYRIALFGSETPGDTSRSDTDLDPPVEAGERRAVEIEDIGQQGDGIARVERGYVVVVPEAEEGERVVIEITEVKPNVAFGDVVDIPPGGETETS